MCAWSLNGVSLKNQHHNHIPLTSPSKDNKLAVNPRGRGEENMVSPLSQPVILVIALTARQASRRKNKPTFKNEHKHKRSDDEALTTKHWRFPVRRSLARLAAAAAGDQSAGVSPGRTVPGGFASSFTVELRVETPATFILRENPIHTWDLAPWIMTSSGGRCNRNVLNDLRRFSHFCLLVPPVLWHLSSSCLWL